MLSGNSVVRAFMTATGARPKAAKINLMDCTKIWFMNGVDNVN